MDEAVYLLAGVRLTNYISPRMTGMFRLPLINRSFVIFPQPLFITPLSLSPRHLGTADLYLYSIEYRVSTPPQMSRLREIQPEEITVAIFCALTDESVAVRLTLEEELKCPMPGRKYLYNFGRIGEHNLVIAQPIEVGTVDTSNLAAYVSNAFKNVRFALMVGIGGGIPSEKNDIRLGDIAVSKAGSGHPGVIQYDFVKYGADSVVQRKGTLNKTHPVLQSADILVEQDEMMGRSELYLKLSSISRTDPKWRRPKAPDVLYAPSFHHVDKGKDCTACEQSSCREAVMRDGGRDAPEVHRGLILSGNSDVKDPEARQRLSRGLDGAICFEMGAAGIMDEIPCLVIRGISDYCDTHKQCSRHGCCICSYDPPQNPWPRSEQHGTRGTENAANATQQ